MALHKLCAERERHMLWAINRKLGKVVQVYCDIPNSDSNDAYLEKWDPDFDNYPYLTFTGHHNQDSFDEFTDLFTRFVAIKDEATYLSFGQHLRERYGAY